jgi:hypothetical protein
MSIDESPISGVFVGIAALVVVAVGVDEIPPNLNHRGPGEDGKEEDAGRQHIMETVNQNAERELGEAERE